MEAHLQYLVLLLLMLAVAVDLLVQLQQKAVVVVEEVQVALEHLLEGLELPIQAVVVAVDGNKIPPLERLAAPALLS